MCRICGWYNKYLEEKKIYKCDKCEIKIDREILMDKGNPSSWQLVAKSKMNLYKTMISI